MLVHCYLLARSLLPTQVVRTVPSWRCKMCFASTVHVIENHVVRLNNLLGEISDGRLLRDEAYIKVVRDEVSSVLSNGGLQNSEENLHAMAGVMQAIAKNCPFIFPGHQELFDSISEELLRTRDEKVLRVLLPSFLMACKSARYYSPPLMSHVGGYVVDNLKHFTQSELNAIVHAYAKLNHHLPDLVPAVEGLVVSKNLRTANSYLLWNLAWCGMVFSQYPEKVLSLILTEDYIEGCSGSLFDDFFTVLFQLKLSLNKERPDLPMCLGPDNENDLKQWGVCRSGLEGIGSGMMRRCYMIKFRQYYTRGHSTFGMKVHTAINTTLGGTKYAQFDGLSLSGYVLDFEVLLDRNNAPVPIPELWRRRNSQTLAASVGELTPKWKKVRGRLPPDLVEDMRRTEEAGGDGQVENLEASQFPLPEHGHNVGPTSLASDWGTKFARVPTSVARRLAIEANGPSHYAGNCDHPLGATVLKTRHLQYLGWEVLNVNYREWMHLQSQEEKAKFIKSMIHGDSLV